MKRIHYLLLGLALSLCIAAVSPTLPPTQIIAGSGVTVTTNGVNNFTLGAIGGSGAPLAGTNVWTGTNTFDGNINVLRNYTLFETNFTLSPIVGSATVGYNVAGYVTTTSTNIIANSAWETNLFSVTLPALHATNSQVLISIAYRRTNAVANLTGAFDIYVGTNWISTVGSLIGTTATVTNVLIIARADQGVEIFRNYGSMSVQMPNPQIPNATFFSVAGGNGSTSYFTPASHIDSSAPWTLTVKCGWLAAALTVTNMYIERFVVSEIVPPNGF